MEKQEGDLSQNDEDIADPKLEAVKSEPIGDDDDDVPIFPDL